MGAAIPAPLQLASDQELVLQVIAGSERAFETLYRRHQRGLLGLCRRMLGSREEADEALQHTFMAAWGELARSGPPAALRPWLYAIARNRCVSLLRARHQPAPGPLPAHASIDLAAAVLERDEARAVLADLARLPAEQRTALVLAALCGNSPDGIADVLGCRREQVKGFVFQARSALVTSRLARETPCSDVRAELAARRRGRLRAPLRHHLDICAGCREFHQELRAGRRRLHGLWPLAPLWALRRAVPGIALGGGPGGVAIGVGGLAVTVVILGAAPGAPVHPGSERAHAPAVASAGAAGGPAPNQSARARSADAERRRPSAGSGFADPSPKREPDVTTAGDRGARPAVALAAGSPPAVAQADRAGRDDAGERAAAPVDAETPGPAAGAAPSANRATKPAGPDRAAAVAQPPPGDARRVTPVREGAATRGRTRPDSQVRREAASYRRAPAGARLDAPARGAGPDAPMRGPRAVDDGPEAARRDPPAHDPRPAGDGPGAARPDSPIDEPASPNGAPPATTGRSTAPPDIGGADAPRQPQADAPPGGDATTNESRGDAADAGPPSSGRPRSERGRPG